VAFSLGGCVDARLKSNSGGSTGTVIDFGVPILMAVSVVPGGTGKYSMSGITFTLSLWKRVKKDLSVTRYLVSDQAPGTNPELAVEVGLGSVAGFVRAARQSATSETFADLAGFKVLTSTVTALSTGKIVPALFTPVDRLAAVAAPGAAPSLACFAGDANAFISGTGHDLLSVASPPYTTSAPVTSMVSETATLRNYVATFLGGGDSLAVGLAVDFALDGSGCTIRVNGGVAEQTYLGRTVAALTSAAQTFEQAAE